jgi:hypothetical protein
MQQALNLVGLSSKIAGPACKFHVIDKTRVNKRKSVATMSEVEADDIVTQQVTDALLLFFNGPGMVLQVRIDTLTDMLATLIGGDAEQFDRCLDRMSRKIDAQRSK